MNQRERRASFGIFLEEGGVREGRAFLLRLQSGLLKYSRAGFVPADENSTLPPEIAWPKACAIWLRAELPVHRKRIAGFLAIAKILN